MLIVHSSSICDVCFDEYKQRNPPSAIPCGHIFCYRCLAACQPSVCPLCRESFKLTHVIKLRTDTQSGETKKQPRHRASSSTSSSGAHSPRRHGKNSGAESNNRVPIQYDETKQTIQEAIERISVHEAIEASLKLRLSEVEQERDSYFRQLISAMTDPPLSRLSEDNSMGQLQRTTQQLLYDVATNASVNESTPSLVEDTSTSRYAELISLLNLPDTRS